MNINQVVVNLHNTITGKELMLKNLNPNNPYSGEFMDDVQTAVRRATIEFLSINIAELKRILIDIEHCGK